MKQAGHRRLTVASLVVGVVVRLVVGVVIRLVVGVVIRLVVGVVVRLVVGVVVLAVLVRILLGPVALRLLPRVLREQPRQAARVGHARRAGKRDPGVLVAFGDGRQVFELVRRKRAILPAQAGDTQVRARPCRKL